ncbi:MAG: tRNA (guanosine(46)-N7)-methyltransferase TrmB [Planctomycetes bacterium]|nr:tRNA (guanosine(46)-N7)-methyltransferase TrmB [Planctomycetota bacterium]
MTTISDIICDPPEAGKLFDPAVAFGSAGPFELEIGCGKGGFLLRRAQSHPELRLLGIEWANKYFKYAADRMARRGATNVRIMRTDARHFVIHSLPPNCLSALHVYHPDPWPKKRHHRRRLFQKDFVESAVQALMPSARWAIQTDHAEYFEWIREVTSQTTGIEQTEYDDPEFGIAKASARTNFEIKYRKEGRTIYCLAFRRTQ